jgi:hypothetical protein
VAAKAWAALAAMRAMKAGHPHPAAWHLLPRRVLRSRRLHPGKRQRPGPPADLMTWMTTFRSRPLPCLRNVENNLKSPRSAGFFIVAFDNCSRVGGCQQTCSVDQWMA